MIHIKLCDYDGYFDESHKGIIISKPFNFDMIGFLVVYRAGQALSGVIKTNNAVTAFKEAFVNANGKLIIMADNNTSNPTTTNAVDYMSGPFTVSNDISFITEDNLSRIVLLSPNAISDILLSDNYMKIYGVHGRNIRGEFDTEKSRKVLLDFMHRNSPVDILSDYMYENSQTNSESELTVIK